MIPDAPFEAVHNNLPWPNDGDREPRVERASFTASNGGPVFVRPTYGTNSDLSENIANISNSYYGKEVKYSGTEDDHFELELKLFMERYDQNGVEEIDRPEAFEIMLTGHSLQFYFDNFQGKRDTIANLYNGIRERFLTMEHVRALLREKDSTNFNIVMSKNPDKKGTECLEILVSPLQDIQSVLIMEYQNKMVLLKKLLNAVKDVESCKRAYFKPASDLPGIIADLHASLAATLSRREPNPQEVFIGRKFEGNRRVRSSKICFFCKKEGRWSAMHTPSEQMNALKQNKTFRSFLTSIMDGSDADDGAELADELKEIAAHVIKVQVNEQEDIGDGSGANVCTIHQSDGPTCYLKAPAENATYHRLSAYYMEPSKYSENILFGILIDMGCAHASSGEAGQYRAYCRHVGETENIGRSDEANCKFGVGLAISTGTATIMFPVVHLMHAFKIHIVETEVPLFLISRGYGQPPANV